MCVHIHICVYTYMCIYNDFTSGSDGKESTHNAENSGQYQTLVKLLSSRNP